MSAVGGREAGPAGLGPRRGLARGAASGLTGVEVRAEGEAGVEEGRRHGQGQQRGGHPQAGAALRTPAAPARAAPSPERPPQVRSAPCLPRPRAPQPQPPGRRGAGCGCGRRSGPVPERAAATDEAPPPGRPRRRGAPGWCSPKTLAGARAGGDSLPGWGGTETRGAPRQVGARRRLGAQRHGGSTETQDGKLGDEEGGHGGGGRGALGGGRCTELGARRREGARRRGVGTAARGVRRHTRGWAPCHAGGIRKRAQGGRRRAQGAHAHGARGRHAACTRRFGRQLGVWSPRPLGGSGPGGAGGLFVHEPPAPVPRCDNRAEGAAAPARE